MAETLWGDLLFNKFKINSASCVTPGEAQYNTDEWFRLTPDVIGWKQLTHISGIYRTKDLVVMTGSSELINKGCAKNKGSAEKSHLWIKISM